MAQVRLLRRPGIDVAVPVFVRPRCDGSDARLSVLERSRAEPSPPALPRKGGGSARLRKLSLCVLVVSR
jgi:hypothetical protein